MKVRIYPSGRVWCEAVVELPLSAGAAWGQLRDFKSSATHDPFHAEIIIDGVNELDSNVTRASGPCGWHGGLRTPLIKEPNARAGGPGCGHFSWQLRSLPLAPGSAGVSTPAERGANGNANKNGHARCPCHSELHLKSGVPRVGAQLQILHRHLFWHSVRVGRILRWKEGQGFAFSDLCAADSSKAFPHVLIYQLQPIDEKSCRLILRIGGRWTAPVPRWMGRIWLWWVFAHVVRTVQNQLLRFALGMRLRAAIVG